MVLNISVFYCHLLKLVIKLAVAVQNGRKYISTDNLKGSKELLNEKIRSTEVRLIGDEGENFGTIPTKQALEMARERDLDLVVVSPNQSPPVAKIMDWGKYKYETEKRAKEARKKQHTVDIKEVKMRYKIDTHDYEVRLKAAKKFTAAGNKVKLVVMLRGREMQHNKLAIALAERFIGDLEGEELLVERRPLLEGKNVVAILAPAPSK